MTTETIVSRASRSARPPALARRRLGALAAFAAVYTYGLIVFGGIVRITGSGMGCGDDWPRCNGQWIPEFTFETLIEYTHRLLAAGIGLVVLAVFAYAILHRRAPGVGGRGGLLRPLAAGAVLLAIQIVLGAVTVRLELPTGVTVAHFIMAMLFMATLVVTAIRGGVLGAAEARTREQPEHEAVDGSARDERAGGRRGAVDRRAWRMAAAAVALGLLVVSLGALTANSPGAPEACRGFPLCSGRLLPFSTTAHVHWTHRLFAILLLFHVLGATWSAHRRRAPAAVRGAARATLGLITIQIALAAALVILPLPIHLQIAHLAVGAAIWVALVAWATLAARGAADSAIAQLP